jgi:hypothetical protein
VAEVGFVFAPPDRIVAPWPRHVLWPDEEQKVLVVMQQVEEFGAALHAPCWLFPDGRAPTPVTCDNPRSWLARWSEGRASYVRR